VRERIAAEGGRLSIAAVNGPRSAVIAGDDEALTAFADACRAEQIRVKRIAVDYASHSIQVEELPTRSAMCWPGSSRDRPTFRSTRPCSGAGPMPLN